MKKRLLALFGAFLALVALPAAAQEPAGGSVEVDYNQPKK